jgi:hypothetical protein
VRPTRGNSTSAPGMRDLEARSRSVDGLRRGGLVLASDMVDRLRTLVLRWLRTRQVSCSDLPPLIRHT